MEVYKWDTQDLTLKIICIPVSYYVKSKIPEGTKCIWCLNREEYGVMFFMFMEIQIKQKNIMQHGTLLELGAYPGTNIDVKDPKLKHIETKLIIMIPLPNTIKRLVLNRGVCSCFDRNHDSFRPRSIWISRMKAERINYRAYVLRNVWTRLLFIAVQKLHWCELYTVCIINAHLNCNANLIRAAQ